MAAAYYDYPRAGRTLLGGLLSHFDPASYSILSREDPGRDPSAPVPDNRVYRLPLPVPWLKRGRRPLMRAHVPVLRSQVRRVVDEVRPDVLVVLYPELHFVEAVADVAQGARIPWAVYLCDTLEQGHQIGWEARWARRLRPRLLCEASAAFAVTPALAEFTSASWGVRCASVPHAYPEAIPDSPPPDLHSASAFLGGRFYEVNRRSTARLVSAFARCGCRVTLCTPTSQAHLEAHGIPTRGVQVAYVADRPTYLATIRQNGMLAISLDWPDEIDWEDVHLKTAFPTRSVELIASGRAVLVHCPADYYLARFFADRGCGLVVSERSMAAIDQAVRRLLDDADLRASLGAKALEAARFFQSDRVAAVLQAEVKAAAEAGWGRGLVPCPLGQDQAGNHA